MKLLKTHKEQSKLTEFQRSIIETCIDEYKDKRWLFRCAVTLLLQLSKEEIRNGKRFDSTTEIRLGVRNGDMIFLLHMCRKIVFERRLTEREHNTLIIFLIRYTQQICLRIGCNNVLKFKEIHKLQDTLFCKKRINKLEIQ